MEKFKRYMKILDKGLSAIGIAFTVVAIVMLALSVIGFIGIDGVEIGEIDTKLELGVLELTVADAELQKIENATMSLAVTALILSAQFVISLFLVKVLRKLIAPMKEGRVFDEAVCKAIKELALYVLIGGLVSEVLAVAGNMLMISCFDISALFDSAAVTAHSYAFDIDGTCVVYAAVIYLLSYVFGYGCELQSQVDETL